MTRHPIASRAMRFARSRRTLPRNFFIQKSRRVFGTEARTQPLCLCQKQPWTNTTVRHRGSTMSGVPGSPRSCRRNLRPAECKTDRTSTSGAVFLPRTWRISRLLRSDTGGSITRPDFGAGSLSLLSMRSSFIATTYTCNTCRRPEAAFPARRVLGGSYSTRRRRAKSVEARSCGRGCRKNFKAAKNLWGLTPIHAPGEHHGDMPN